MTAGGLRAERIGKVFGDGTRALGEISFELLPGEILTLLGPSGCGKSTLLRIVAGLDPQTEGTLTLDGRPLDSVPPGLRDVGFVFQNYALYPHMTVRKNLGLGLSARGASRPEVERRVHETAALLGIETLLGRYPRQLSGGQQQRVALGRALVRRPKLLLLDEPLSNLDAQLRESMRGELKSLFRSIGATVLYVTHDQAEALSLADRLVVLETGRIRQMAPPLEVYAHPADLFVATFVGSPRMSILEGRREGDRISFDGTPAALELAAPPEIPEEGAALLGVRPEDLELAPDADPGSREAELELAEPLGASVLLTLRVGGCRLRSLAPAIPSGPVRILWPPRRVHFFDGRTRRRVSEPPA
ncbi:MAG: ABC transporter ATP-binding protein [Acidithiobacillales bacterium]